MLSLVGLNTSVLNGTAWDDALPDDVNGTSSSSSSLAQTEAGQILGWAIFVMACLGMPGNVLVIVVYSHNLTTSIRLYIFALAISDTVICVTVIVTRVLRTFAGVQPLSNVVAMALISVAGSYSFYILTVTAVERFLSVSRPLTFTFSERRAHVVLCALVPCSLATAAIVLTPKYRGMPLLARLLAVVIQSLCTLVIITMYTLMARIIGLRVRARRAVLALRISLTSLAEAHAQQQRLNGTSGRAAGGGAAAGENQRMRQRVSVAGGGPRRVRGVWMLFVITVVFILCWLPLWMAQGGVAMPVAVINLFILLSSVVNPLIYSFMSGMFRDDVKKFYRRKCSANNVVL